MQITQTKIDTLWGGIGETKKEANGITIERDRNNTVFLYSSDGSYEKYDIACDDYGVWSVKVDSYEADNTWTGDDSRGDYEEEHAAIVAAHESALAEFDGMAY